MVDSTICCLKELKEDPKTSKLFKDRTGVFKEIMGEEWESKGNPELFDRTVYCSCIQGDESFKSFNNISSVFSMFDSRLFHRSKDCLQEYGKDNLSSIDQLLCLWEANGIWGEDMGFHTWYWQTGHLIRVQSILNCAVFTVQVVLSSRILRQYHQCLQVVTSHLLTKSALNSDFPNLATWYCITDPKMCILPVTKATVECSFSDIYMRRWRQG